MTLRVYIAGPEVFLPNARAQLDRKIALTRAAGLVPVSPGDLAIPPQPDKRQLGRKISEIDEQMMDSAGAIIANLTPYRGIGADQGTCYELGYMCAQGKLAYAYTNVAADMRARTLAHFSGVTTDEPDGRLRGPDGCLIEDVDMIDNLMLQGGIERRGGSVVVHAAAAGEELTDTTAFETCLALLVKRAGLGG